MRNRTGVGCCRGGAAVRRGWAVRARVPQRRSRGRQGASGGRKRKLRERLRLWRRWSAGVAGSAEDEPVASGATPPTGLCEWKCRQLQACNRDDEKRVMRDMILRPNSSEECWANVWADRRCGRVALGGGVVGRGWWKVRKQSGRVVRLKIDALQRLQCLQWLDGPAKPNL
jgi:hypothetical protein